jgi:hypothetical protein
MDCALAVKEEQRFPSSQEQDPINAEKQGILGNPGHEVTP